MSDLDQFKQTYITECYELLEEMEEILLNIDEKEADQEDLNAIFRCAHSIKGGGGAFGFNELVNFTHVLETLLDEAREGRVAVSREVIDALLKSVDVVKFLVSAANSGDAVPDDYGDDLKQELMDLAGDGVDVGDEPNVLAATNDVQEEGEVEFFDIQFTPHESLFVTGNEPLLIIRELIRLGTVEVSVNSEKIPPVNDFDPNKCYLTWQLEVTTDKGLSAIKEAFEFVEDDCDLSIEEFAALNLPAKPPENSVSDSTQQEAPKRDANSVPPQSQNKTPAVTSIRVDIEKIDQLVNMVGELVITQAMITAQTKDLSPEKFPRLMQGVGELSQHTRELQESVMSVRMQPVKSIFSRMPRIVRDLSTQLNKDIRIEMHGENTEIDKTVIEQLSDPLTHMIRNSVDHGIELPDERLKKGKASEGVISLSADHSGGRIIIEISDDGDGINREKVLQKAKDKGLVAADAQLSNEEIDDLIFMPGFSTAEEVTNVSGRGVGMDVVRRNIESLGGTVEVKNIPGEGSVFTVSLPLTLAIMDGMIVKVGNEDYIIPINNIIESLRPSIDEVQQVADGGEVINVRGQFVPVLYLCRVFNIPNAIDDVSKGLVVLVENGRDRLGIVVDELLGQQQVVIKNIEENADPIEGVGGATILGDGNVSLILDIAELQAMLHSLDPRKYREEQRLSA